MQAEILTGFRFFILTSAFCNLHRKISRYILAAEDQLATKVSWNYSVRLEFEVDHCWLILVLLWLHCVSPLLTTAVSCHARLQIYKCKWSLAVNARYLQITFGKEYAKVGEMKCTKDWKHDSFKSLLSPLSASTPKRKREKKNFELLVFFAVEIEACGSEVYAFGKISCTSLPHDVWGCHHFLPLDP